MDPETITATGFDVSGAKFPTIDHTSLQYTNAQTHLTCPICQLPFYDPCTTVCGHTFCYMCLDESLKMTGLRCPLDRTPLLIDDLSKVYPAPVIVKNLLDEMKVGCLNGPRGCEWIGPRWEIKSHLEADCGYTRFECTFARDGSVCGTLTERRLLDGANQCLHQKTSCECGKEMALLEISSHQESDCEAKQVACNGCNLTFTPAELESHGAYCEKAYMKCQASAYGCDWKGTRSLFETVHEKTCAVLKMSGYLQEQSDTIAALAGQNQSLEKKMAMILDSISQGQVRNLGFGSNFDEVSSDRWLTRPDRGGETSATAPTSAMSASELGNVRSEIAKLQATLLNSTQNAVHNLMSDTWRLKDELNLQKATVATLRQQVHFLIMERRNKTAPNGYPGLNYSSDDDNSSSSSANGLKL